MNESTEIPTPSESTAAINNALDANGTLIGVQLNETQTSVVGTFNPYIVLGTLRVNGVHGDWLCFGYIIKDNAYVGN